MKEERRSDTGPIDPKLGLVTRKYSIGEDYPRQRRPSIPRRRRNDSYRAPCYDGYDDSDDSDDRRSPSPPRVYCKSFRRVRVSSDYPFYRNRHSLSSLSDSFSPPRGSSSRYRDVSPIYRRWRITPEQSFGVPRPFPYIAVVEKRLSRVSIPRKARRHFLPE